VIRPPISPRLAVSAAALLALVLVPGSAQAAARAPARPVIGAGSFAELQTLAKAPPHIVPVGMPYWTDCLVALQQGTVAAVSGDDAILVGLAAQDSDTRMVGPTIVAEPQGLALPASHPEFVRFVNAVLAQWRADGGWAASYARWIGRPVPAPPPLRYAD
jgi:polar amino acid transport system substrate-binding protein